MSEKKSILQTVIIGVLVIFIFVAVLIFSTQGKEKNKVYGVTVNVWGVLSDDDFQYFLRYLSSKNKNIKINYTQIEERGFENQLTNALAEDRGPDLFIVPSDFVFQNFNKISLIPYKSFSLKQFRDRFVEVGESNLRKDGILAFPFLLDPMVMFWNRDMFADASISLPPKYWDELLSYIPRLVKKDSSLIINKAGVALGEFRNIKSAKDIFMTLILQAGNPVITRGEKEKKDYFSGLLNNSLGYKIKPSEAALIFFTQFADPTKEVYSWNRSLPQDIDMFASNDLAIYFGHYSDVELIIRKNPNLNFDISIMPQSRAEDSGAVYGKTYIIAIANNSQKKNASLQYMSELTGVELSKILSESFGLISPVRAVLADIPQDPEETVAYKSAILMKSVYEPSYSEIGEIFSNMVESYLSGVIRTPEIIANASEKLNKIVSAINEDIAK